ncbi:MAG: hypothetical protein OXU26_05100 [Acidobacteriota bacterium]|nr:hypothetical protein [Acidobacteriota bacterium]MDE2963268.1 hypothetical protein [Acidobacteriota bacterium]
MQVDRQIIALIRAFAAARDISVSYASMLLTGSGDTVKRIEGGMSLTSRRAERIVERAARLWPAGVPWPDEATRLKGTHGEPLAGSPGGRRSGGKNPGGGNK